ncbi:hypothetical protein [Mesorhizobium ventifaucium]|uniref:Uncharacterized protein n=1 Tax=Mesorhizobium ventifaucium TaxID=666020 RepID=A0ABN8K378_9HYPH|nr:hypothetical protein [Mesorhizobium ventifaucium]CAH2404725.1 hypothetical protein MES4922_370006 [Mesorhizobium ventifaucium]
MYREEKELAAQAGVPIDEFLDDYYAKGFRKESEANRAVHYLLFYNSISAPQCKRDYLIQRVRQTKIYYRDNRKISRKKVEYLVEVFKLNSYGHTKRADGHVQLHFLGDAQSRKTVVDIEVGCGEVRSVADGSDWPFEQKILFKKLQDYSNKPGLYDKVSFESSRSYSFTSEFDRNGHKITLPDSSGNLLRSRPVGAAGPLSCRTPSRGLKGEIGSFAVLPAL